MKKLYILIRLLLLILIFPIACDTEELHNLNIDPYSVNQMDINYFFTAAELGSTNGTVGISTDSEITINIRMFGSVIQHLATLEGSQGDKYVEEGWFIYDANDMLYNTYIQDIGKKTYEILKQTGPGGAYEGHKFYTRQAARILRVFCFHRVTDWFGNIPYFESNKGLEGIFQPRYDKQKDIYADLLKELDEACIALNESHPDEGFSYADIIFNGDRSKWRKWGYSLMFRLAMRVSNVDQALAENYVTKAISGGVIESNDDNVWVPMDFEPLEEINQNGISRSFSPDDQGLWSTDLLSKTLVDWLMGPDKTSTTDDDPRLMIFTGGIIEWSTDNSVIPIDTDPLGQKGLPNGLDQSMLNDMMGGDIIPYQNFSAVNPLMMQKDEPYQLMNAAESQFLMAEALERGIGTAITGTAEQHYRNGVKLALQMYIKYDTSFYVSDSRVDQYLSLFPFGVFKPKLEMIGEQMWASKFLNWGEAWSDWRRTGYPQLTPTNYPDNDTNGQIPTKLKIPYAEEANNPNFQAGATKPNSFVGVVWWDGGPE